MLLLAKLLNSHEVRLPLIMTMIIQCVELRQVGKLVCGNDCQHVVLQIPATVTKAGGRAYHTAVAACQWIQAPRQQ